MNLYKYLEGIYTKENYEEKGYTLEKFIDLWFSGAFMETKSILKNENLIKVKINNLLEKIELYE